jgi:peptide/nickel transport system substrate-binding protein
VIACRRAWIGLLTLAMLACGGPVADVPPGTVVVGIEGNPSVLDPRYATGAYATRILPLLFSSLVTQAPRGNVVPDLAETWTLEGDRTYRFRLKDGVRFHDGTPLTSRDVKFTFDYVRDPANGCPAAGGLEVVDAVDAPDARTVVFRLREVSAPFLLKLTRGIVPAHLAADKDAFGARPVGSGPFAFVAQRPGESVLVRRWDGYFGDAGKPPDPARIAGVQFRVIENDTTRMLLLRKGDLHVVQNAVQPLALKFFERMPSVRVVREPGINYQYLGFNLDDPLVGRVEVRRAIAHAIDRETIIRALLSGQARPATGLLAPSNWAYAADVPTYEYDPAKARALLDGAGLPDRVGDGPAARFTLSYKTSTSPLANEVADVIAGQLAAVGIGIEKRAFEWGTFYGDIKAGNFQMYSLSWVGVTDPDLFHYVYHSASVPPEGANRGRYRNPEVDRLIEESRVTLDVNARRALYAEVQRIVARDCVTVSLWWTDNIVVQSARLSPLMIYPGGEYTSLAEARWR